MINQGKIIIDKDNIKLIADLKKAIAKEGSRQRDESGKLEKDFDFINSIEYALYPFRTLIYNDEIPILEFENML